MDDTGNICEHRWLYFVDVTSKAVRTRKCERCGAKAEVGAAKPPLPLSA
jgi:hypothetical protein